MKSILMAGLVAAALSAATASACTLNVTVACCNGTTSCGINVCAASSGCTPICALTDSTGLAQIELPGPGTYTVCVDPSTLPAGATVCDSCCTTVSFDCCDSVPSVTIALCGNFCTPPTSSVCWMTGGGTIGKKQQPDYSYGGVVYPGCSPKAADGGNWNVIDHNLGIHFQGQHIIVDACSGAPTKSPKVPVRIIDFHGDGIVSGVAGNPLATIPVTFVGRAIDNKDGGANNDNLFLLVTAGSTIYMQIGNSPSDPATVSTGNLQIHISSCGK